MIARYDAAGNYLWSKSFPDTSAALPTDLRDDGTGNLLLVGAIQPGGGQFDFGGLPISQPCGNNTMYVQKLDAAGNAIWGEEYGCGTAPWDAVDASHYLHLGYDSTIEKIDTAGGVTWSKTFVPSKSATTTNVATDGVGDTITIGTLAGSIDFGGGPISSAGQWGCWIAKFDPSGNHLWSKMLNPAGGSQVVTGVTVATDMADAVIVAGVLVGSADFGGGFLSGGTQGRAFLAKYDSLGNYAWAFAFGNGVDSGPVPSASGLAVGPGNSIIMTGGYFGTVDFGGGMLTAPSKYQAGFLVSFDQSGAFLWNQNIATFDTDADATCLANQTGTVTIFGDFNQTVAFSNAFAGAQYSTNGSVDLYLARFAP